MNEKEQTREQGLLKFDPIVLVRDVMKRWALILLVVIAFSIAAYLYSTATYSPSYKTSITYVTYSRGSATTVYSNLSAANAVASVFEELLNSSLLHNTILKESGLSDFGGTINARVIPDTNLITVDISGPDARSVFLMAKAIVDHHELVTYQVIDNVSLELLRSPTVPTAPSNVSNARSLVKTAAGASAVAMVLLLAFLSFQRDAVRSGREAQSKLDCSYLGDIPHESKFKSLKNRLLRKKTDILVTNPLSSFRYVESFRKLASRVEHHMHERKVVMITSLMENEGKSTVSVNLAMSLALKHDKVLLIDCDLRKPACWGLLELKEVPHGLCDVLSGKVKAEKAVLRDKKSGLNMLLETNGTQDSDDYLSSESMNRLLQWARENYDLVVLDLPPMALVSDAESVMELADSSLLVVRQNMAMAAGINKAIATLESGKAKLLGCVLNDACSSGLSGGGYGYGYGYGYSYGYGYGRYGKYGKYGNYGHYGHYSQYNPDENSD